MLVGGEALLLAMRIIRASLLVLVIYSNRVLTIKHLASEVVSGVITWRCVVSLWNVLGLLRYRLTNGAILVRLFLLLRMEEAPKR